MVLSGHRVALVGHYRIWWPFHHHAPTPWLISRWVYMYLYKYMRPPDYPLSGFTQLDREKGQTVHHWQCCLSNLKLLQIGWGRLLVALQVLQPPVYTPDTNIPKLFTHESLWNCHKTLLYSADVLRLLPDFELADLCFVVPLKTKRLLLNVVVFLNAHHSSNHEVKHKDDNSVLDLNLIINIPINNTFIIIDSWN